MNINNSYKRFQSYTNSAKQNNFKQDFMEQNYKVEKKSIDNKKEVNGINQLSQQNTSFLKNSTRLNDNQNQFLKK